MVKMVNTINSTALCNPGCVAGKVVGGSPMDGSTKCHRQLPRSSKDSAAAADDPSPTGSCSSEQQQDHWEDDADVPVLMHTGSWGVTALQRLMKVAERKKYYKRGSWLEYFPGEGSVVLAAPHDGMCEPELLPRRTAGVTVRDTGTKGLAAAVAMTLIERGAPRPHLVVCHLSRKHLDVNRPRENCAEHNLIKRTWDKYHELLESSWKAAAQAAPGRALFLDIHAQGNWRSTDTDAIELGTLHPSGDDLRRGSRHLDQLAEGWLRKARVCKVQGAEAVASALQGNFTMPRLAGAVLARGGSFANLLCGSNSLGGLLAQHACQAVPSPELPVPPTISRRAKLEDAAGSASDSEESDNEECTAASKSAPYFSGRNSYVLQRASYVLDALQMEYPSRLTRCSEEWGSLARALICSFEELWFAHYGSEFGISDCIKREPGDQLVAFKSLADSAAARHFSQVERRRVEGAQRRLQDLQHLSRADLSHSSWSVKRDTSLNLVGAVRRGKAVDGSFTDMFCEILFHDVDFLRAAVALYEPRIQRKWVADLKRVVILGERADKMLYAIFNEDKRFDVRQVELFDAFDEPDGGILQTSRPCPAGSTLFPGVQAPPLPEGHHWAAPTESVSWLVPLPSGGCKFRMVTRASWSSVGVSIPGTSGVCWERVPLSEASEFTTAWVATVANNFQLFQRLQHEAVDKMLRTSHRGRFYRRCQRRMAMPEPH